MTATDELRKWAEEFWEFAYSKFGDQAELLAIADRIDAEQERQLEVLYRDMSDAEYVKLPKDADGEYTHVGDVMEYPNGGREEVRFMTLNGAGWLVNEAGWLPVQLHHHHAPTVEDVLWEFGIDWEHESDCEDRAALLKEYAAKLRLKEDE